MDSVEKCIVERARHEQEIQNRLKRLNERKLQIQECKIQEVKASNACLGDTDSGGIVSDKGNDQSLENQSNTSGDKSSMSRNECNDKSTLGMIRISNLSMTQNQWLRYGYCKYHKKRAKTRQKQTRERKEYTRDGKVSTKGKNTTSIQLPYVALRFKYYALAWQRNVITAHDWLHLVKELHVDFKQTHLKGKFALNSMQKKHIHLLMVGLPAWQSVCYLFIVRLQFKIEIQLEIKG
ncbi:hypothetical protein Tco_1439138 [Tanacetum coccineum]